MKITSKSDYALIIMIELAKLKKDEVLPLSKISHEYHLSLSYLEQLASRLKLAKLIDSKQGVKGGYFLAKKASAITPVTIIEAIGDEIHPVACCSADSLQSCNKQEKCIAKQSWKTIGKIIHDSLASVTLDQII